MPSVPNNVYENFGDQGSYGASGTLYRLSGEHQSQQVPGNIYRLSAAGIIYPATGGLYLPQAAVDAILNAESFRFQVGLEITETGVSESWDYTAGAGQTNNSGTVTGTAATGDDLWDNWESGVGAISTTASDSGGNKSGSPSPGDIGYTWAWSVILDLVRPVLVTIDGAEYWMIPCTCGFAAARWEADEDSLWVIDGSMRTGNQAGGCYEATNQYRDIIAAYTPGFATLDGFSAIFGTDLTSGNAFTAPTWTCAITTIPR